MTTRAQLLNNLSSNKWVIDASFTRLNARPLDNSSIFGTFSEASSYAKLSGAAYPGQHVTVLEEDQINNYYIDLNGNLSSLAPDPVGYVSSVISNITADISVDTDGLSVITRLQQTDGKINASYRRLSADDVYGLSDVAGKVWIQNKDESLLEKPDLSALYNGTKSDLSVRKIPRDEWEILVARGAIDQRTIYILSSEHEDAYGQEIWNLSTQGVDVVSPAANIGYVDNKIGEVKTVLRNIYSDISSLTETATVGDMLSALLYIKSRLSSI